MCGRMYGIEYIIEFTMNFHPSHGSSLADAEGRIELPGAASMPGAVSGNWQVVDMPVPEDGFGGLIMESGRCLAFNTRGGLAVSDDGESCEAVHHPFEVAPTRFGATNGRFFGFSLASSERLITMDLCKHFGLNQMPFTRHIAAGNLYPSGQFTECTARLQFIVDHRVFGVITGEVGVGKSNGR